MITTLSTPEHQSPVGASSPRYLAAQIGARRGYAVPAILASAGLLSGFLTDICGNVGLGRLAALGASFSPELRRLARRQIPAQIAALTETFPWRTAFYMYKDRRYAGQGEEQFRAHLKWQCELGFAAAHSGLANATHLFSMMGEFPTLSIAAKQRGLRTVSEVFIPLSTERMLAEEYKAFPGWSTDTINRAAIRREVLSIDVLLTKTDHFICPSDHVRDDLVSQGDVPCHSISVIPYGVDPSLLTYQPAPRHGRVLFAGTADLRKGIHYLGMAAEYLANRRAGLEFLVAGGVASCVVHQPVCRHLNFLGRIDRCDMQKEFQKADLFVLPSLAEGSAEVTYEALAAGVPVITTKSAGSVIRDGIEGRIIPERDPNALAEAIRELTEDRQLRNRMAVAARKRAEDFTWDRYGERLLRCLENLPS